MTEPKNPGSNLGVLESAYIMLNYTDILNKSSEKFIGEKSGGRAYHLNICPLNLCLRERREGRLSRCINTYFLHKPERGRGMERGGKFLV